MNDFHLPVLLDETLQGLRVKENGRYIDATVGGGGHAKEIIRRGGRVLAIDQDEDAISHIKKKFESEIREGKLILELGNFSEIGRIAQKHGFDTVDGILFDLGVSSYQLDKSGRGFSFMRSEPLDMRMSAKGVLSAFDVVNKFSEEELYEIFARFGEERKAHGIAKKIVEARQIAPIKDTLQLSEVILGVIPKTGEVHPSTKTFQAIRIYVNDELGVLRKALNSGFKLLGNDGRMVIISFHSLEDRIVKLFAVDIKRNGLGEIVTKKPIVANIEEIRKNRRSRSAKLRIIQRYSRMV